MDGVLVAVMKCLRAGLRKTGKCFGRNYCDKDQPADLADRSGEVPVRQCLSQLPGELAVGLVADCRAGGLPVPVYAASNPKIAL